MTARSRVRVTSLHLSFFVFGGVTAEFGLTESAEDVRFEIYSEPGEVIELHADNEWVTEDDTDANGQAVVSGKCPDTGWCQFEVRRVVEEVVVETTTIRLRRG